MTMEMSRAKHDAPSPVYLEKSGGMGAGLGCSHQQGRPPRPGTALQGLYLALRYKAGSAPGPMSPEAGDPETARAEAGESGAAG